MSAARKLTSWEEPETLSVGLRSVPAANDNALWAFDAQRENSRLGIFVLAHTSLPACEPANDGIAAAESELPSRTAPEPGITGKEEDVEVGLQYFGKRYLNPLLGRWISADPLAVHAPGEADHNTYAYVRGGVLKAIDPLGLKDEAPAKAGPDIVYQGVVEDGGQQWHQWSSIDGSMTFLELVDDPGAAGNGASPAPDLHSGDTTPQADPEVLQDQKRLAELQGRDLEAPASRAPPTVDELQELGDVTIQALDATGLWSVAAAVLEVTSAGVDALQGQGAEAGSRLAGAATPFVAGGIAAKAGRLSKEAVEEATRKRASKVLKTDLKSGPQDGPDFYDAAGRSYDAIGNPNMVAEWEKQRAKFMKQVDRHLLKADFTIVDLTGMPDNVKNDVIDHILGLSDENFDKIIPIGFYE